MRSLFLIHWSMFAILSEQDDTKYLFVWVDAQLVPMVHKPEKVNVCDTM